MPQRNRTTSLWSMKEMDLTMPADVIAVLHIPAEKPIGEYFFVCMDLDRIQIFTAIFACNCGLALIWHHQTEVSGDGTHRNSPKPMITITCRQRFILIKCLQSFKDVCWSAQGFLHSSTFLHIGQQIRETSNYSFITTKAVHSTTTILKCDHGYL